MRPASADDGAGDDGAPDSEAASTDEAGADVADVDGGNGSEPAETDTTPPGPPAHDPALAELEAEIQAETEAGGHPPAPVPGDDVPPAPDLTASGGGPTDSRTDGVVARARRRRVRHGPGATALADPPPAPASATPPTGPGPRPGRGRPAGGAGRCRRRPGRHRAGRRPAAPGRSRRPGGDGRRPAGARSAPAPSAAPSCSRSTPADRWAPTAGSRPPPAPSSACWPTPTCGGTGWRWSRSGPTRPTSCFPPPPASSWPATRLAELPTGGVTPLAEGITAGLSLARRAADDGWPPLFVLITDGRATGNQAARERALAAAGDVAASGIQVIVVDAEDGPTRLGLAGELAEAMGARHLQPRRAHARRRSRTPSARRCAARSRPRGGSDACSGGTSQRTGRVCRAGVRLGRRTPDPTTGNHESGCRAPGPATDDSHRHWLASRLLRGPTAAPHRRGAARRARGQVTSYELAGR